MESYLHLFETEQEFDAQYEGSGYTEPWVSYTMETSAVTFNKGPHDYSQDYLTFEILSAGNICWFVEEESENPKTIEYKLNDGNWTSLTPKDDSSAIISVVPGDKVMFRGNNATYMDSDTGGYNKFEGSTAVFNLCGNIMSLVAGDNFATATTLTGTYNFATMFNYTSAVSASNLILPATALTEYCYMSMFEGCGSLIQAPELPATTLAEVCYQNMFQGCTSLTTAPAILPATTLADSCYQYMFYGCTSLTSAPELPATTLADNCYEGMFDECENLNYVKCLATDISAEGCTSDWLHHVSSTGTFITPSSTQWTTGVSGIPTGWTRVNA